MKPAVTKPAAVTSTPALSEDAAAREALRRAMEQPATAPAVAPIAPIAPPVDASASAKNAAAQAKAAAKAREDAARQAQKEADAAGVAEKKASANAEKKRRDEEKRLSKIKTSAPSTLPALPTVDSKLPVSKTQRLAELLEKYRRDEITPADYHGQRAKILAEP